MSNEHFFPLKIKTCLNINCMNDQVSDTGSCESLLLFGGLMTNTLLALFRIYFTLLAVYRLF